MQTNDGWGGEHPPLILIFGMTRGGAMNYAVSIDMMFVTGRTVKTRLSKEARSIRNFCATHTVKVYDDPQLERLL